MGCFFGCFRGRDSKSKLVTPPENAESRSKNALSSLFLCDDDSVRKGKEGQNPLPPELDARELKNMAKFHKACGTLPETPVKIPNTLEKWEDKSAQNGEENCSKFNSSMEKLKLEKQSDKSSKAIPIKKCEEWVTGSGSLVDSPSNSSCITDGHNTRRLSSGPMQRRNIQNVITPIHMPDSETHSEVSSVTHQISAPSVQCVNRSARFDCDSDASDFSSECASQHSKVSGLAGMVSVTKPTMNSMAGGEVTKVEFQGKELKDENSDSNHLEESIKLNDEDNLMSTPMLEMAVKRLSVEKETNNEASLSSWLKPVSAKPDGNNEKFGFSGKKVCWGKAPADRPILGMVAAHWNDNETSHISPKWWDGNGIPNSTNKYKEDQKVSWHATPFEERLEKALSEETFISQRKHIGGTPPLELDETEESDTALSHLQSSAHIKSVVSF